MLEDADKDGVPEEKVNGNHGGYKNDNARVGNRLFAPRPGHMTKLGARLFDVGCYSVRHFLRKNRPKAYLYTTPFPAYRQ